MIFGGYALDRESIDKMMARLEELQPKMILEFGSGTSTLFLSIWAQENDANIITLEHLEEFAKKTKELCENVKTNIVYASIKDGFYDTDMPFNIDFALIDGPPRTIGRQETFPKLWSHLSKDFEVWLDDANRDHEKKCLKQWSAKYPITVETNTRGKGLAVIRRK